jgi:hypothetical protein
MSTDGITESCIYTLGMNSTDENKNMFMYICVQKHLICESQLKV